jgi:hypothetical protein
VESGTELERLRAALAARDADLAARDAKLAALQAELVAERARRAELDPALTVARTSRGPAEASNPRIHGETTSSGS